MSGKGQLGGIDVPTSSDSNPQSLNPKYRGGQVSKDGHGSHTMPHVNHEPNPALLRSSKQQSSGSQRSSKHRGPALDNSQLQGAISHKSSKHGPKMTVDDGPDRVYDMMNEIGLQGTSHNSNTMPAQFGGPQPGPVPPFQQPINMQPQQNMSFGVNDWEEREELKQRELDEARARVAQMEKTMRWWSDCTTNWREKWSKVRNERNKSREECRQLRAKLEATVKELSMLKREKHDLFAENDKLRKEIQDLKESSQHVDKSVEHDVDSDRTLDGMSEDEKQIPEHDKVTESPTGGSTIQAKGDLNFLDQLLQKKDSDTGSMKSDRLDSPRKPNKYIDHPTPDDNLADRKVAAIEKKLDEAQKTIKAEREDKNGLVKTIEKLQSDLSSMKNKYEDLKKSKHDALHQLSIVKEEHADQVSRIALELEDESTSRYSMDNTISDLRIELERLQSENASEWGKRERLETEKLSLERENKKLRTQIGDLTEELDKKKKDAIATVGSDMKSLQDSLYDANRELNDLKHTHSKLKKVLQDRTIELDHSKRRSEQYELEVKKLRSRIEELKRDLATAEDDVDTQTNTIRKLQRTNDELQEEMESQQVQVEHLQTRLKRTNQFDIFKKSSIKSLSQDESNNDGSDEEVD